MHDVKLLTTEYSQGLGRDEIERFQIDRFNIIWRYCQDNVPFYQSWASEHGLPTRINDLAELRRFPLLTKAIFVERAREIFDDGVGGTIKLAYSTGGSTGTPVRFPRGEDDAHRAYANVYTLRSWWGINPFDPYVHLWGHAHLFGTGGLTGKAIKLNRQLKDWLVNATRLNAYDMTEEALASHYMALERRNPAYVVGYTSAIFKLARHIEARGEDVSKLTKLRAVLVTAETVTEADVDLISKVFGVPVIIEYGAAETGVMAGSRGGSWPLQVLWRSYVISVAEKDGEISVTTLDDRRFPLINYAIGDRGEGGDVVNGNALTLGAVAGRKQDVISVSAMNGEHLYLSAILPVHILKSQIGITAVQLRQDSPGRLRIFLAADRDLAIDQLTEIITAALMDEHTGFDPSSVTLEQVQAPVLTKAGKQALFV